MPETITGATLDHVAVAVERWSEVWPRYAVELGGQWTSGGVNVGFSPAQLRYANGGRVEILQPWEPDKNPFLRRFLDRHGPSPHHLTFKVPELASALDDARHAGFTPVSVDLSSDDWKEAFLHPRQATGIVVQLAQATHGWESPAPEGFPATGARPPSSLTRVTHAVADLDTGLALFEGLLGGRRVADGTGPDRALGVRRPAVAGTSALRLIAPVRRRRRRTGADASLAGMAGAVARAGCTIWPSPSPPRRHRGRTGPSSTDGPGRPRADGPARVIEPADNLGTRLVLLEATPGRTVSTTIRPATGEEGGPRTFDSLGRTLSEDR